MAVEIKIGYPIILKNPKGLKKYGLTKNMEGFCNALTTVPDQGAYLMFQPAGLDRFYWIEEDRCEVDEVKLAIMQEDTDDEC